MTSMVFSEDRPHEASYVVYFNGIEVPCEGIDVRMAINTVPTADVYVAPDRELQRLGSEDRVQVAAFYLDDIHTELSGTNPDFRLLYEGDIVGWSYSNSDHGRSLMFRTVNFLDILNHLYISFITGLDSLVTQQITGARTGEQVASVQYGPTFPAVILLRGLDVKAKQLIRRPYDLVENSLRLAVGSLEQHNLGSVAATNFFARYIKKVGLLDRFVPSPILEIDHMRLADETDPEGVFPILRYVRQQDTLDLFTKYMNQLASGSMLGIITDVFQRMYYEYTALTTAPIAQVNFSGPGVRGEILGPPAFSPQAEQKGSELVEGTLPSSSGAANPAKPNRILNYVTKPQWKFGVPPACNVIFPSTYSQFTFEEDYASQPTRLHMNNEWLVNTFQADNKLSEFMVPACGYPKQAQMELQKRMGTRSQGNQAVSGKNYLVWPEEYFKGPVSREAVLPRWFMMLLQNANRKSSEPGKNPPYEFDQLLLELGYPVSSEDGVLVEGAVDPIQQSFFTLPEDREPTEAEQIEAKRQKMEWLQQLYAREEFYRQRSSFKNAAVQSMFNPYVVPGFPAFVFDELTTGNHVVGYLVAATHSLRATGFSTSMSLTHCQTLDEYMHQMLDARMGRNLESRTYMVDAAPADPIPELRFVTQTIGKAEEYFTTLLHQKQKYKGALVKTAAFDYKKAIRLVLESGERVSIENARETLVGSYLDKYVQVVPADNFAAMFSQAQAAMAFVSRPICTLEEYVSFHERGVRKGKVYPNDERQGKGAVFYEKILSLVQGPGDPPVLDENNYPTRPISADTRANWEERLVNYRTKVLFQLHPQEA